MTVLQQQAEEALNRLAQLAHDAAATERNPAQTRFNAHIARDKYREALSLIQEAAALLQNEPTCP